MSSYINYPLGTKVRIKSSDKIGEAYESVFGVISVFVDGERYARNFKIEDVEFIKEIPDKNNKNR